MYEAPPIARGGRTGGGVLDIVIFVLGTIVFATVVSPVIAVIGLVFSKRHRGAWSAALVITGILCLLMLMLLSNSLGGCCI